MNYLFKFKSLLLLCVILQACSAVEKSDIDETLEEKVTSATTDQTKATIDQTKKKGIVIIDDNGKLGDLFKSGSDEIGSVNKYLWQASIEVLSFLPINSADPFSGIIVFGKGKAPGSSQFYDATVYISDPALDARSFSVTVRSSNGTVSSEAEYEIESAVLSRARQLRLKELDL
ncbi:DUF3576 domain-containing protein [Amylibacter sp.]|nr:DUF3576 domain-containing protein [Amylibacter sp.]